MRPPPAVPAADLALTIVPPVASGIAPVTSGAGLAIPKISPDGSFVAYFDGSRTLQLRRLNSTTPEQLPGLDGAWFVWSPDSKFLMFVDRNTLKRIRVPDGAPETIGVAPPNAVLNGTTESGALIFMRPDFTLLLAPRAGAEASEVRVPGLQDGSIGSVRVLPGGDDFLIRFVPQGSEQSEIYLVTVRNGNLSDPVLLMSNAVAPSYTPAGGGRILFIRNDNLYAQRLNRRTRRLEGDPELVQRGVASGAEFLAAFSVSDSGIVAWRPGRAALAQVTIFDRQGTPIGTAGPFSNTGALKLSSDEQHVLLAERNGRAWLLEPNQAGRLDAGSRPPQHVVVAGRLGVPRPSGIAGCRAPGHRFERGPRIGPGARPRPSGRRVRRWQAGPVQKELLVRSVFRAPGRQAGRSCPQDRPDGQADFECPLLSRRALDRLSGGWTRTGGRRLRAAVSGPCPAEADHQQRSKPSLAEGRQGNRVSGSRPHLVRSAWIPQAVSFAPARPRPCSRCVRWRALEECVGSRSLRSRAMARASTTSNQWNSHRIPM